MLSMLFNQSVAATFLHMFVCIRPVCVWAEPYCVVVYPGFPGSRRCVWSPVATTSPLWSLRMKCRLVLHETHCRALRSRKRMLWRSHSLRNNTSQEQLVSYMPTHTHSQVLVFFIFVLFFYKMNSSGLLFEFEDILRIVQWLISAAQVVDFFPLSSRITCKYTLILSSCCVFIVLTVP